MQCPLYCLFEFQNELENLPFSNEVSEFCLPEDLTNPEISASQPCSPATSTEDGPSMPDTYL